VKLGFVAVTGLKDYAVLLIEPGDGYDGLELRYVQKNDEQMTAVDLEFGMTDAGLY
jgi:hypothetical protein